MIIIKIAYNPEFSDYFLNKIETNIIPTMESYCLMNHESYQYDISLIKKYTKEHKQDFEQKDIDLLNNLIKRKINFIEF